MSGAILHEVGEQASPIEATANLVRALVAIWNAADKDLRDDVLAWVADAGLPPSTLAGFVNLPSSEQRMSAAWAKFVALKRWNVDRCTGHDTLAPPPPAPQAEAALQSLAANLRSITAGLMLLHGAAWSDALAIDVAADSLILGNAFADETELIVIARRPTSDPRKQS